jgi:predicted phosphodiesterase
MERWPHERLIESGRSSLHLVHGSPRDPVDEYLHPDTPLDDLVGFAKAPFVVMGHSHRPFVRSARGTTFVNVGSCGLPRDDARWGAVALFYPADARWRILRFDISEHSETALARYSVHQSVKDLFAKRRSEEIFGEITC